MRPAKLGCRVRAAPQLLQMLDVLPVYILPPMESQRAANVPGNLLGLNALDQHYPIGHASSPPPPQVQQGLMQHPTLGTPHMAGPVLPLWTMEHVMELMETSSPSCVDPFCNYQHSCHETYAGDEVDVCVLFCQKHTTTLCGECKES